MQHYFLFFGASSLALPKVVMKYVFDFFRKPISPFSKFWAYCLWASTSYTVIIVFWMMLMQPVIAPVCWWPCACLKCVSGPRRLEKLDFFEMYTCLWPGAQLLFRHKWRKVTTTSLLLHFIDGYSCLGYWNEFLSSMFQVLDRTLLALQCHGNVCNWNPKLIWPRLRYFWKFLLEYASFPRLNICTDCNLHELRCCYSFWRHQSFSKASLTGILACSLKMLVRFSHRFL